ncbi:MAG: hypothetical protein K6E79_03530 [Pseudobutyrivibrio sp.]|nr:hypothetical protein [Pseudobutyrivibrio sp.]
MVIQNSEVSMTSKASYVSGYRVDAQTTITPAFKLGDIVFAVNDEGAKNGGSSEENVKAVGKENSDSTIDPFVSANRQTRMQTMSYLLRLLLMSKIFGEENDFFSLLGGGMENGGSYIETTTMTYQRWESQQVDYSSSGMVTTADGRNINFNYSFAMSESFSETFSVTDSRLRQFIDPLVVNLDSKPTEISNMSFFFDLDGDGEEEEINNIGPGSGFLALDRNEDGEINNGMELFGAKTGNGFAELAVFDEDGNGWIDENDPIYEKLRIWTINEDGDKELYGLKHSDVGAICLAHVRTDFMNHGDQGEERAAIRKSGIFLRESDGSAGGVQHVDFAKKRPIEKDNNVDFV